MKERYYCCLLSLSTADHAARACLCGRRRPRGSRWTRASSEHPIRSTTRPVASYRRSQRKFPCFAEHEGGTS